jgi:hypothetical protein
MIVFTCGYLGRSAVVLSFSAAALPRVLLPWSARLSRCLSGKSRAGDRGGRHLKKVKRPGG